MQRRVPTTWASPAAGNATYNPKTGGSTAVGSTGDYRLDVSLDIGDTMAAAVTTGLVLGGSFAQPNTPLGDGTLGSNDIDYYKFVAPAGSNLKAVTSLPADGRQMDTVLQIFDSNGDATGCEHRLQGGYARLDYYPFTDTTNTTYYVAVSGLMDSDGVRSTGDYRLDLSLDHGDTLKRPRSPVWSALAVSPNRWPGSGTATSTARTWTSISSLPWPTAC